MSIIIQWFLLFMSVLLYSDDGSGGDVIRVDALGPSGYVMTFELERGENDSILVYLVEGEERDQVGRMYPLEEGRSRVVVCERSGGEEEARFDMGAIMTDPNITTLSELADGGPALHLEFDQGSLAVARRGSNLYTSADGWTYVVRHGE
jgi:hypothetical protein